MGAVAFVRQYGPQLRQQAKRAGVRAKLRWPRGEWQLYWVGKELAGEQAAGPSLFMARQACRSSKLPLRRFTLPGALCDHIPFSDLGLERDL